MPATATEMSTSEAARCLGIAAETLRTWARRGTVPYRESPLGMLFDAAAVHVLAARREQAAREKRHSRQVAR